MILLRMRVSPRRRSRRRHAFAFAIRDIRHADYAI